MKPTHVFPAKDAVESRRKARHLLHPNVRQARQPWGTRKTRIFAFAATSTAAALQGVLTERGNINHTVMSVTTISKAITYERARIDIGNGNPGVLTTRLHIRLAHFAAFFDRRWTRIEQITRAGAARHYSPDEDIGIGGTRLDHDHGGRRRPPATSTPGCRVSIHPMATARKRPA